MPAKLQTKPSNIPPGRHLSEIPEVAAIQAVDWWGEHPKCSREDWQVAAGSGDTQLGYWQWVEHRLEEAANEEEETSTGCRI